MLFKDVIGQQQVKQHLVEMVQHNRLSHALLFLGKEGSGSLPLALAFANYICSIPSSSVTEPAANLFGEPVEVKLPATADEADLWMQNQSSFSKTQALVHPDIHYSYPTIKRDTKHEKPISTDFIVNWREFIQQYPYGNVFDWLQFIGAENKQGNITAHECNDIIRQLNLKSFESGYKILLMWMPEYLGKEGNKLLKLIEEPPPDTLFILVAESEEKILSTILSRCQLIKIPTIDSADIEKQMISKANCQTQQAKHIANASNGNYREALHLLQHADEDFSSLLKEWMNATLKNQTVAQVKIIEELARLGRERQKQFLKHFTHLIEQAIRLEIGNELMKNKLETSMSSGELEFINKMNKAINLEQKQAVSEEIEKATYHIERNANAKILLHALTIKIFYIVKHNLVPSV